MTGLPGTGAILAAMDATWAPAALHRTGPWLLREGRGGGNRVSCITQEAAADLPADIAPVAAAARALGQTPVFRIAPEAAPDDAALDAALDRLGYPLSHPVALHAAPVALLAQEPPPVTAFALWPPLQIQRDLWEETGIGPARLAVMDRAPEPRAALLGRVRDGAAGVGFVAIAGDIAMIHAVGVLPELRRLGTARHMLARAAVWAAENGATTLALAVEAENHGAIALYAAAGMQLAGRYHYRAAPEAG